MSNIAQLQSIILAQETQFLDVRVDDKINFKREAEFALQHLQANSFTASTAASNQQSLMDAITNVAAIGISLNPAEKHAYLVPRDGKVCLDISARGLLNLAIESGAILWGQTKIVHARDSYENNGVDKAPTHSYSPFADRGDPVGAYCTVKTVSGDFLTEEMPIKEIFAIRERSQSFKKGRSSPWKTDEGEMIRKTVTKRAAKYWPKSTRIAAAIDHLNRQGEGVDFNSEQRQVAMPSEDVIAEINLLLTATSTDVAAVLSYASGALFRRQVGSLDDLTAEEAGKLVAILNQKALKMGVGK